MAFPIALSKRPALGSFPEMAVLNNGELTTLEEKKNHENGGKKMSGYKFINFKKMDFLVVRNI